LVWNLALWLFNNIANLRYTNWKSFVRNSEIVYVSKKGTF
jgi:hypothetical protein